MTITSKINARRLFTGGVAAGLLLNIVTAVGNSTVFKPDFLAWADGLGEHLHPPSQGNQILLWVVMCFIDAFLGVWLYAGLRPRFGAGPKTAFLAGVSVWVIGRFCVALDMLGLGVFPLQILIGQSILGLVAILPSILLGAWIYREGDQ
jgi:hypothetical protein